MDMEEYKKTRAKISLISELAKGEESGRGSGWIGIEDVERDIKNRRLTDKSTAVCLYY